MSDPRIECDHASFSAGVNIVRLEDDATGKADGFVAEIQVRCLDCGTAFEFAGVDTIGLSHSRPATSADGKQLRAPIRPPSNLPALT